MVADMGSVGPGTKQDLINQRVSEFMKNNPGFGGTFPNKLKKEVEEGLTHKRENMIEDYFPWKLESDPTKSKELFKAEQAKAHMTPEELEILEGERKSFTSKARSKAAASDAILPLLLEQIAGNMDYGYSPHIPSLTNPDASRLLDLIGDSPAQSGLPGGEITTPKTERPFNPELMYQKGGPVPTQELGPEFGISGGGGAHDAIDSEITANTLKSYLVNALGVGTLGKLATSGPRVGQPLRGLVGTGGATEFGKRALGLVGKGAGVATARGAGALAGGPTAILLSLLAGKGVEELYNMLPSEKPLPEHMDPNSPNYVSAKQWAEMDDAMKAEYADELTKLRAINADWPVGQVPQDYGSGYSDETGTYDAEGNLIEGPEPGPIEGTPNPYWLFR